MHGKDYQLQQSLDAMTTMLAAFAAQLDRLDERLALLERRSGRLHHLCQTPPEEAASACQNR